MKQDFFHRFGMFLVYGLLTFITFGIYPIYYYFSRKDEELALLREIAANTRAKQEVPHLRVVA
jgi:hypothetical protein